MTVTPSTVPQAADVRPVTGRWARLLPWSSVLHVMRSGNPLFNLETRRLPHGGTPDDLGRWTRRIAFLTLLVLLLLGGLLLGAVAADYSVYLSSGADYDEDYDVVYPIYGILTWTASGGEFLLYPLSLVASLLIDFSSLHAGRTEAQRDQSANQSGLLTLIPLSDRQRFAARHTLARVRSWWAVIVVVTLRVGVVIVHFAPGLIPNPHLSGQLDLLRNARMSAYSNAVPLVLVALLVEIAMYTVLLLEPFWRQRAMTAAGVAAGTFSPRAGGLGWSVWLPGLALIGFTGWLTYSGFMVWSYQAQSAVQEWLYTTVGQTMQFDDAGQYAIFRHYEHLARIAFHVFHGLLFFGYYRLIAGMSARVAEARLG